MNTITVRNLQQQGRQTVDAAQKERVVITRHGRPAAIVIGIEGYDWEDVFWATSPSFWGTLRARRKEAGIPLEEARKRLERRWSARKRGGRNPASRVFISPSRDRASRRRRDLP